MKIHFAVVSVVLLLLAVVVCQAEVYRYTDSKGELHFVDDISKVPKKFRKQAESAEQQGNVSSMDAATATSSPNARAPQETPKQRGRTPGSVKVEVFMTSWCGYCKKLERFLNEKGIPYVAYDIEKDSSAASTFKQLGGRGVPVVRIGSHVVQGYNPDAVMGYYKEGN